MFRWLWHEIQSVLWSTTSMSTFEGRRTLKVSQIRKGKVWLKRTSIQVGSIYAFVSWGTFSSAPHVVGRGRELCQMMCHCYSRRSRYWLFTCPKTLVHGKVSMWSSLLFPVLSSPTCTFSRVREGSVRSVTFGEGQESVQDMCNEKRKVYEERKDWELEDYLIFKFCGRDRGPGSQWRGRRPASYLGGVVINTLECGSSNQ